MSTRIVEVAGNVVLTICWLDIDPEDSIRHTKLSASVAADANNPPATSTSEKALTKQQKRLAQIRAEGGSLAFNTKYGALNPYAIYYGLVSIRLGLV